MAQGRRAGAKIPSYKKEKEWGRKRDGEGEGKGERERVRWVEVWPVLKKNGFGSGPSGQDKWQSNR